MQSHTQQFSLPALHFWILRPSFLGSCKPCSVTPIDPSAEAYDTPESVGLPLEWQEAEACVWSENPGPSTPKASHRRPGGRCSGVRAGEPSVQGAELVSWKSGTKGGLWETFLGGAPKVVVCTHGPGPPTPWRQWDTSSRARGGAWPWKSGNRNSCRLLPGRLVCAGEPSTCPC